MADREVDQQLVERAQRGDKRAFELLVLKYQRKLRTAAVAAGARPRRGRGCDAGGIHQGLPCVAFVSRGQRVLYVACIGSRSIRPRITWSRWGGGRRRRPGSTTRRRRISKDAEQLRDSATPEDELHGQADRDHRQQGDGRVAEDLRTAITAARDRGLELRRDCQRDELSDWHGAFRIFRAREAIAGELRPLLGTDKDRRW